MPERSRSPNEGGLLHVILDHGRKRPNALALIAGHGRLTWRDLAERVLAYGGTVRDAVAERGGRVATLGANSADHVVAYLAIVAAGRCAVPLPLSARPEVISGMLADCAPDLVLLDEAGEAALGASPGMASKRLGSEPAAKPLETAVEAAPEAPFNIIYSSGTTGRPKGIVQPHRMRFRQSMRGTFGLGPDAVMLLATPLCSNTTLMPLLATLAHGGCVVLMRKFDAAGYLDLAEKLRATHTMLVPVQYKRILAVPDFMARDLSAFRVKQSTGAPMDGETKRHASREWPGKLLEIYGLTEGGCTCILDHEAHPDKAGTVGRPAPGCEVRIVDETGRSVPPGGTGEVVGRSPMMMSGYFGRPDATEAFLLRAPDGVFHRTGDLGRFDADGFLTLVGRKKDVIISGGFNIYAVDLEEVLESHPGVAEAAVVAVPSEEWGETPLAFVVPEAGTALAPEELREWANDRLGRPQRLSAVEFRAALPRSEMGKVLKTELRAPYWKAEDAA